MKASSLLLLLGGLYVGSKLLKPAAACAGCPPRGISTTTGRTCTCICHSQPGIVHVVACCLPASTKPEDMILAGIGGP